MWTGGRSSGNGKLTDSDGRVYEGEWKDDNPWNGLGTYKYSDGRVYEGEFRDDELWTGVLYHPIAQDRSQMVETYKEGECVGVELVARASAV